MDEGPRISSIEAMLMVCLALFYDGLQLGIDIITFGFGFLVNWIISIWAWLSFYLWFKLKGVSFSSWRNALLLNGGALVELTPLPFIDALPLWTAAVVSIILNNRIKKI